MNIWERRAIARGRQEMHIRQQMRKVVETVAFYIGAVAWIVFIAHLFVVTALG